MGKYRKNVGIVVANRTGQVLMCARADKKNMQWQFPQGGIEPGEDIVAAGKRELREETGITSVRLITKLEEPLRYDFPPQVLAARRQQGWPYVGQEQYWLLFAFRGDDSEIDFCTNPQEIEFKAYEWVDIAEAPERIVEFKRNVYKSVAEAFAPYLQPRAEK